MACLQLFPKLVLYVSLFQSLSVIQMVSLILLLLLAKGLILGNHPTTSAFFLLQASRRPLSQYWNPLLRVSCWYSY